MSVLLTMTSGAGHFAAVGTPGCCQSVSIKRVADSTAVEVGRRPLEDVEAAIVDFGLRNGPGRRDRRANGLAGSEPFPLDAPDAAARNRRNCHGLHSTTGFAASTPASAAWAPDARNRALNPSAATTKVRRVLRIGPAARGTGSGMESANGPAEDTLRRAGGHAAPGPAMRPLAGVSKDSIVFGGGAQGMFLATSAAYQVSATSCDPAGFG